MTNRDQFFQSWLIGFLFCLGLSLGSLGLLMLQHLTGDAIEITEWISSEQPVGLQGGSSRVHHQLEH